MLNTHLTACTEKLADAETLAEKVQSEKDQLEKKLAQVQENWEKYMERG
jgi:chemotaxis regulatin CheY-phosphate phosphatase CheZ